MLKRERDRQYQSFLCPEAADIRLDEWDENGESKFTSGFVLRYVMIERKENSAGEEWSVITVDKDKCIGCGECAGDCLTKDIVIEDKKARAKNKRCIDCGHCVAVCPVRAISLIGYDMGEVVEYHKESFVLDPDRLLHFMQFRRSIRHFKRERVSRALLERVIEAGRFAPTAKNMQNVSYIVVEDTMDKVKEMAWEGLRAYAFRENDVLMQMRYKNYIEKKETEDTLFFGASQLLIVLAKRDIDGGLACDNIELMANALGLGVLYSGYTERGIRNNRQAKEYLGIEEEDTFIACMLLGWPDVKYRRTVPRKKAKIKWM